MTLEKNIMKSKEQSNNTFGTMKTVLKKFLSREEQHVLKQSCNIATETNSGRNDVGNRHLLLMLLGSVPVKNYAKIIDSILMR